MNRDLDRDATFSAAYYLKEMVVGGLLQALFIDALAKARDAGELWWEVRALQELGWDEELRDCLLRNQEAIDASDNISLALELARVRGDDDEYVALVKELETGKERQGSTVWFPPRRRQGGS